MLNAITVCKKILNPTVVNIFVFCLGCIAGISVTLTYISQVTNKMEYGTYTDELTKCVQRMEELDKQYIKEYGNIKNYILKIQSRIYEENKKIKK